MDNKMTNKALENNVSNSMHTHSDSSQVNNVPKSQINDISTHSVIK